MKKTKKKKNVETSEMVELRKIYKDAWEEGIFLKEFKAGKGSLVAAGSIEQLKKIGKLLGLKDPLKTLDTLGLGEFIALGTVPGSGSTRAQACRNAVAEFKKHKVRK